MDQAIRQEVINPAQSFLLEAPAGSGKTTVLIQRLLRLLAVVDHPESILALTFTRKAAAEMRERLLSALNMAATEARPDDAMRAQLWDLAQQVLRRDKDLSWGLLQQPSRLRLMTLDALNASLVRQLPLLSEMGESPVLADDARVLYRQAAKRMWLRSMEADAVEHAEAVLLLLDHQMDYAIDLIADMLSKREQWIRVIAPHIRDMSFLREQMQDFLYAFIEYDLQRIQNAMQAIGAVDELPELLHFSAEYLNHDGLRNFRWPRASIEDLAQWQLLADAMLTKSGTWRKKLTKAEGFPAGKEYQAKKAAFLAILEGLSAHDDVAKALHALRRYQNPLAFDAWDMVESVAYLLILAYDDLQKVFAEQKQVDYTEISLAAIRALSDDDDDENHPSDMLLRLDHQIQHILVDEFQDTSELQIDLLRLLTSAWQAGEQRSLFVVGDPMQSIYRFRKADVGLFLQAADHTLELPCLEVRHLQQNFRSSVTIVDWVNQVFQKLLPQDDDALRAAIAYRSSQAFHQQQGVVQLYTHHDDRVEAEKILSLMRGHLDQGQNMAVLVRSRSHAVPLMHLLLKQGIAFRAVNMLHLHEQPEVLLLLSLIRLIQQELDTVAWAAVLRAPCCGLKKHDLLLLMQSLSDEESLATRMQHQQWPEAISEDGKQRLKHVSDAIMDVLSFYGRVPLEPLLRQCWQRLAMPQLLSATANGNIEQVLDCVAKLEQGGRIDLQLLQQALDDLYAMADMSEQAARIELMTMHSAKGLQWPVVFLPGLGKSTKANDVQVLNMCQAHLQGESALLLAAKGARGAKNPVHELIKSLESEKDHYEQQRLFYVACTRAEQALYLLGAISKSSQKASKNSLLSFLQQAGELDAEPLTAEGVPKSDIAVHAQVLQRLDRIPETVSWQPGEPLQDDVLYQWSGPEAAPVGNVLHAALQAVAETGIGLWDDEKTMALETKMHDQLRAEGLSGQALEAAFKRCQQGLTTTLASEKGRWILSGEHQQAKTEWSLMFAQAAYLNHAIIDRSFIDAGVRWVIDYKTASHQGGGLSDFLDAEAQRHRSQLQRYAELLRAYDPNTPVRMAIYFPLCDGWRVL